jgi:hypothetical protein
MLLIENENLSSPYWFNLEGFNRVTSAEELLEKISHHVQKYSYFSVVEFILVIYKSLFHPTAEKYRIEPTKFMETLNLADIAIKTKKVQFAKNNEYIIKPNISTPSKITSFFRGTYKGLRWDIIIKDGIITKIPETPVENIFKATPIVTL